MAKILSDKEKSLIVADYKTGQYSQRELSKKHNVSIGTVNKLTKDIETSNEHIVNAQKSVLIANATLPNDEMNAIMNAATNKFRREGLINNNAELIASKIPTMLEQIDSPSDLKTLAEANDRLAITLKVAERHAPKSDTNVAIQNNNLVTTGDAVSDAIKRKFNT